MNLPDDTYDFSKRTSVQMIGDPLRMGALCCDGQNSLFDFMCLSPSVCRKSWRSQSSFQMDIPMKRMPSGVGSMAARR